MRIIPLISKCHRKKRKHISHFRCFQATSIGFHGNIVAVWERFSSIYETTGEMLVDLGSDQTSCHNPFNGGYYPVQLSFAEAEKV